jgi:hypothetical protein
MSKRWMISRRTVLRGAGATLALPLLEAMLPANAYAQAAAIQRFFTIYFPDGTYPGTQITGRAMGLWYPPAVGSLSSQPLPPALQPLANNLNDFSVIGNVDNSGRNTSSGGDHSRGLSTFLTCCPQGSSSSVVTTPSLDQVIGDELAKTKTFKKNSVVLAGTGRSKAADGSHIDYTNTLSYRTNTAIAQERNPKRLFDTFFLGMQPPGTTTPTPTTPTEEQLFLKAKYNRSVLDFVKADAARLNAKLGVADQRRVTDYLEQVRDIERRATEYEATQGTGTTPPPPTGCGAPAGNFDSYNSEYLSMQIDGQYTTRVNLMLDIMVAAFQCDMTRVGTLLLAPETSDTSYGNAIPSTMSYEGVSVSGSSHLDAAHHEENLARIKRLISIHYFHLSFFKSLINKMKAVQEVNGTMLDNSVVLYGCGLIDGFHNMFNGPIPLLIGGHSGGMAGNRYINSNKTRLANVYRTIAQKVGVPLTSFGSGSGASNGSFAL